MKTVTTLRFPGIAFILAATAICLSCFLPTSDSPDSRTGSLTVQFSDSSSASRTVVPEIFTSEAAYDISCTDSGGETVASATITALAAKTFSNIAPGSITVTVKAYSSATTKDSSTLIASGTATVTLPEGGAVSAYIALSPVQTESSGIGSFSLTIKWPEASANQIWWYLDGTQQSILTTSSDPAITTDSGTGLSSVTLSATGVASGIHTVRINFNMNGSTGTGTQLEVVNVYDNLLSNMFVGSDGTLSDTRTYTDDEVMNMTESMSTDITLRLIGGDTVETLSLTSGTTSYSTHVITSNVVTVIPSTNGVSQSISYQWNSGSVTTTGSDTPLTLTMATATANTSSIVNNTLLLTVVSPSTGATTTYTITIRSPIHVTDAEGLAAALSAMDNVVVLDTDIDLSTYGTWYHVGTESEPFTGVLDGNDHTISGMTTDVSTIYTPANPLTGMFGCLGTGGVIKNLHLTGLSVPDGTDSHKGGLVSYNLGTIWRCSTSGTVAGDVRVGGLVGRNDGTVSECWSNASVSGTYIGGLVGENYGTIENSYARGKITAHWGGGLVGSTTTSGIVRNCYAAGPMVEDGNVSGNSDEGYFQGLIGNSTGTVSNCFYDFSKISTSYYEGTAITSGYYGASTDFLAMRTKSTFTAASWNFSSVWTFTTGKNGGYPHLRYNTPTTDTAIASASMTATVFEALIEGNLNGDYILSSDLTLSESMTPIGSSSSPFTGTFDGGGHAIINANVNCVIDNCNGFFSYLMGTITNLHLRNILVTQTNSNDATGGIAGYSTGTIYRCSVTGTVSGTRNLTGGLVGNSHGTIRECYFAGSVIATGDTVGGLVGQNVGPLINCYARGTVTGTSKCGGLIGRTSYNTNNSYAAVTVTSSDAAYGGIRGYSYGGTVSSCFYDSSLTSGGNEAGIGTATATAAMKDLSTFTGWGTTIWTRSDLLNNGYPYLLNVPVTNVTIAGGTYTAEAFAALFVDPAGTYTLAGNVTLTGTMTPIGSGTTPFIGTFNGGGYTISGLSLSGSSVTYLGLFGDIGTSGVVKNTKLSGISVASTGANDAYHTGALAATNEGLIFNCSVESGNVSGAYHTGGLVGVNSGTIEYSYSNAAVTGTGDGSMIGGLAGTNFRTIQYSYAAGPVSGTLYVGGFVGLNKGLATNVINCFARGSVTGLSTSGSVGGFVGSIEESGYITNCYSSGLISSSSTPSGGFAGAVTGTLTSCYYDTATSGMSGSGTGYTGCSTTIMQTIGTYSPWDIITGQNTSHIWGIDSTAVINGGYPYLQYFGSNTVSP